MTRPTAHGWEAIPSIGPSIEIGTHLPSFATLGLKSSRVDVTLLTGSYWQNLTRFFAIFKNHRAEMDTKLCSLKVSKLVTLRIVSKLSASWHLLVKWTVLIPLVRITSKCYFFFFFYILLPHHSPISTSFYYLLIVWTSGLENTNMIPIGVDTCDILYLRICEANNGRAWADRLVCLTLWEFNFHTWCRSRKRWMIFFSN